MQNKLRIKSCEISLTDHCNLKCGGCNHASPHLGKRVTPVQTIERDLRALSPVLSTAEIRIAGGEPLLHPQLIEILQMIRELGIADKITLITNGLLLHKMSPEVWKHIDQLWISVYPGVNHKWEYSDILSTARQHGVKVWKKVVKNFQLTMLNDQIEDPDLVRTVYQECSLVREWSCHVIYEGRYYKCTPSALMEGRLEMRGVAFHNKSQDGISLHDNPNLGEALAEYLGTNEPLKACSYCLGSIGKTIPSHQLTKDQLAQELTENHRNPRQLISLSAKIRGRISRFADTLGIFDPVRWKVHFRR